MLRKYLSFVAVVLWCIAASSTPNNPCQKELWGINLTLWPAFYEDAEGRVQMNLVDPKAPGSPVLNLLPRLLRHPMGIGGLSQLYRAVKRDTREGITVYDKFLDHMRTTYEVYGKLSQIPRKGGVIFVSNHPLSGIEVLLAGSVVSQVRPDFKAMVTKYFEGLGIFQSYSIFANVMPGTDNSEAKALSREWLQSGHALFICPAGDVSYIQPGQTEVSDLEWKAGVLSLARKTGVPIVPIFFGGQPSALTLAIRKRNYTAGAGLVLTEFLRLRGRTVRMAVGDLIDPAVIAEGEFEERLRWLRAQTYGLADMIKKEPATYVRPPAPIE